MRLLQFPFHSTLSTRVQQHVATAGLRNQERNLINRFVCLGNRNGGIRGGHRSSDRRLAGVSSPAAAHDQWAGDASHHAVVSAVDQRPETALRLVPVRLVASFSHRCGTGEKWADSRTGRKACQCEISKYLRFVFCPAVWIQDFEHPRFRNENFPHHSAFCHSPPRLWIAHRKERFCRTSASGGWPGATPRDDTPPCRLERFVRFVR